MDADLEMARLSITYGHDKGAADENAQVSRHSRRTQVPIRAQIAGIGAI
jgi:hypothetical protein